MGICSGTVTRGRSPASNVRVRGEVASGGMTEPVYTDHQGRFTLEWRDSSGLSTIHVGGKNMRQRVQSGNSKLHFDVDD